MARWSGNGSNLVRRTRTDDRVNELERTGRGAVHLQSAALHLAAGRFTFVPADANKSRRARGIAATPFHPKADVFITGNATRTAAKSAAIPFDTRQPRFFVFGINPRRWPAFSCKLLLAPGTTLD